MWQQYRIRRGHDAGVDRRFALIDVKAGAGNGTTFQRRDKCRLIDDIAARGVDDIGIR